LILVIEEPELYQHPQQCRHWARVFRRITAAINGRGSPDTQVIFTTHSPHFVDISWFDQVRTIRKLPGARGAPPIARTHRTTLLEVAQELANATGKPARDFTEQSARARARPVMTNLVNEGFFATLAVLVEGGTEVGLLQEVARRMAKDWDAKGIGVIDVGGKTKLSMPLVVFRKMGIPVYLVFDADSHNDAEERQHKTQNRLLLKLLGAAEVDYPPEAAHDKYAVVGEEMGRYLKTALGDEDFNRIADSVAADLGYAGSKDAMKNVEAAALFASRLYDAGKRLLLIEQIVDRITILAPGLAAGDGMVAARGAA
jgi:predicted ATP-dependent endonuclease of OLD family